MGKSTRKIVGILSLLVSIPTFAQQPKAVIGITVDQMKAEYLERFEPYFKEGFRRLLDESLVYRNNHYSHVPTYTAPGHATIFTGAQPTDHGIIANDWYDPFQKRMVYCVEDSTVESVGSDSDNGKMSPRNLLTTSLPDEIALSTANKSYIGSASIKDRGAILPGGHAADDAYWFSPDDGFITSTYYHNELPEWVANFNTNHSDLAAYVEDWDYYVDEEAYTGCLANDNSYEAQIARNGQSGFPYATSDLIKVGGPGVIRVTPWGNQLVTDFALAMLNAIPDTLLEDEAVDFLAFSYSSTDYIGHAFGPRSREVMDAYLRLDHEIGRLLEALDTKFGKGNYILFLSADHAVAENPAHVAEEIGLPVKSHSGADIESEMTDLAIDVLGFNPIEKLQRDQIHFDRAKLEEHNMSAEECALILQDAFRKFDWLSHSYTRNQILSSSNRAATQRSSTLDRRSGDLFLEMRDNHLIYGRTGSSHGSGYTYDTHVPMIIYGTDKPAANIYRKTAVVDLVPTLSFLLKIPLPHSAFGSVLHEAL